MKQRHQCSSVVLCSLISRSPGHIFNLPQAPVHAPNISPCPKHQSMRLAAPHSQGEGKHQAANKWRRHRGKWTHCKSRKQPSFGPSCLAYPKQPPPLAACALLTLRTTCHARHISSTAMHVLDVLHTVRYVKSEKQNTYLMYCTQRESSPLAISDMSASTCKTAMCSHSYDKTTAETLETFNCCRSIASRNPGHRGTWSDHMQAARQHTAQCRVVRPCRAIMKG